MESESVIALCFIAALVVVLMALYAARKTASKTPETLTGVVRPPEENDRL